jgi:hypothetical protein
MRIEHGLLVRLICPILLLGGCNMVLCFLFDWRGVFLWSKVFL